MACPYFLPTEVLPATRWSGKLRPPLGELYRGQCRAHAGEDEPPPEGLLAEVCNLGYAGERCPRFRSAGGPDAVRFTIAGDDGRQVRIRYTIEQGHLPCDHGSLEYSRHAGTWVGLESDTLLFHQADAYLRSYLRWKDGAVAASR
jgi:hypothetical protein